MVDKNQNEVSEARLNIFECKLIYVLKKAPEIVQEHSQQYRWTDIRSTRLYDNGLKPAEDKA